MPGFVADSWVNIEHGHVFKGCGEFKNEMQGPLVWGRVLARAQRDTGARAAGVRRGTMARVRVRLELS